MKPTQIDRTAAVRTRYLASCAGYADGCDSEGPPRGNAYGACSAAVDSGWKWLAKGAAPRPRLFCPGCSMALLDQGIAHEVDP